MNLKHLRDMRDAAARELDRANRAIEEAPRGTDLDVLREAFDNAADEHDRCVKNLRDAERRERVNGDQPEGIRSASAPSRAALGETPIYHDGPDSQSFFADAFRYQYNSDPSARERLERHGRQNVALMRAAGVQLRDVGTSAFAGLTVPQYLVDQFVPIARAGSPTLNMISRKLPLPEHGMTVNLSRITTGAAAAAQATENTAVQETDIDDTLLTVNVRTYAGQQDVSRQALERSELVDVAVFQDLVADYFTKVNDAILNADGTSGTHLGIRSTGGIVAVTYTDASPTVPELYPKLADAIRQVNGSAFQAARATAIIMHSRRWGWITASLDSSLRPLFVPSELGPTNAFATGEAAGYGQVMGKLQALPVISDDGIKTNLGAGTEDVMLIVSAANLTYWQEGDGSPRQFRFEQTNAPQSVRLAVWSYGAFAGGRYPGASATISGSGLAAPVF
jgi:HK97 family phage major capsid protein